MKFNININQKALSGLSDDLDITDCAIVEFIKGMYFWHEADRTTIDGKEYIWISYKMVLDQMPLLRIKNKEVLARRFKKLERIGIVEKEVVDKNKTYFRITDKVGKTIFDSYPQGGSTQKSKGFDSKVEGGSTQKSTYYNKESNNNKINNSEFDLEEEKKKAEENQLNGDPREIMEEAREKAKNKVVSPDSSKDEEEE